MTAGGGVVNTNNQFQLLRERRFAPFFVTQFLGAFNDNVFKNALVIAAHVPGRADCTRRIRQTLINLAAALFILPFFLFSATAGQLAEKFEKSRLIRYVKLFEIAIMVVGAVGFLTAQPVAAARRAVPDGRCIRRCSARSSTRSCRSI